MHEQIFIHSVGRLVGVGHGVEGRDRAPVRLTPEEAESLGRTLQVLSAPSRLRILSELRQRACTVGELTSALELEQSAVSHQLRLLRMSGLVTATRHGRHITYALYDDHVAALLDEAVYHAEHLQLGRTDTGRGA